MRKPYTIIIPFVEMLLVIASGCSSITDFRLPSLRIISPLENETISTATVSIHVVAHDDEELEKIQVYMDDELLHETSHAETKVTYDVQRLGFHDLKVRVYDRSGNWEIETRRFFAGIRAPAYDGFFQRWKPVRFDWADMKGEENYHFQLSRDSTFSTLLVDSLNLKESQVEFAPLRFPRGLLYWRVRALSGEGEWSSAMKVNAAPCEVAWIDTGGFAQEVVIDERIAYIADGAEGVRIVNIEEPGEPVPRGRCYTGGDTQSLFVQGHLLYLADDYGGLKIVNTVVKTRPYIEGQHVSAAARDVYVEGGIAFIADTHKGLKLFDVTVPQNPRLIKRIDTRGFSWGVFVEEGIAYVADFDSIHVVIVDDPLNSYIAGSAPVPFGGWAKRVVKAGDHAFVAAGSQGLRIFDVSNPETPCEIGRCLFFDDTRDIFLGERYAFVADSGAGLRIVDISDPAGPYEVDYIEVRGGVFGVAVSGHYAFIACGYEGFRVIRVE
jgi:hypothetical protein